MSSGDGFKAWWASVVELVRAPSSELRVDPLQTKARAFRELAAAARALEHAGYRIVIEDERGDEPRIAIHRRIPIEMTPPGAPRSPSSTEERPELHVFVSVAVGTGGSCGG